MTTTLSCTRLTATVGAEVDGIDAQQLADDDAVAGAVGRALEQYGVLVFRGLHLEPEAQVAFCRKLGRIDLEPGHHPVPGIYRVTLDRSKNASAEYLKGTFHWHIDGCTQLDGEPPQKATILSAKAVAEHGGETEFASTYAAFDQLDPGEQERCRSLRVVHSLEASQRAANPDPSPELVQRWRSRPTTTHPLVWRHRDGRDSLVVGVHADHVVDIGIAEGRALLADLLTRATTRERVYRHRWSVGDTVVWDNRGVLHRATPYPSDSPREMLRTTVLGDEPIQ